MRDDKRDLLIQSAINRVKTTAGNLASSVKSYFDPTSNGGNNFWNSPINKGLMQYQEKVVPHVKAAAIPIANTLIEGANSFNRLGYSVFDRQKAQPTLQDVGNVGKAGLAMYGAAKTPVMAVMGGLFGGAMNTVGNVITQKPLTQNIGQSIGEGSLGGAIAGPLTKLTNTIFSKALSPIQGAMASRLGAGGANVVQGIGVDLASGRQTTPQSVALDAVLGTVSGRAGFGRPNEMGIEHWRKRSIELPEADKRAIDSIVDAYRNKRKISPQEFKEAEKGLEVYIDRYLGKQWVDQNGFNVNKALKELQKVANKDFTTAYPTMWGFASNSQASGDLVEEARKYKSAEEFISNYKGSGTQYGDYNPSLRYGGTPGSKRLTELGVDPEKEVTIYRGIDDQTGKLARKINDGDFVTTDFESARAYAGSEKDVVKMKVKAKDLGAMSELQKKIPGMGFASDQPKNPQDPFYNVNRIGTDNQQTVADLVQTPEMKTRVKDVVGDKLTFDEVKTKAQVSPELKATKTRLETEKIGAEALALRNRIADLSNSGADNETLKELIIKDKAFGQFVARLLGQRRIVSDPAQKSIFNEMVARILKEGANPDEVIKAAKNVNFEDAKQAAEFYRKFVKTTPEDWLDALRYNSMLSSPNTHINNIFSNLANTSVVAPIEKSLTGAIDLFKSKATGGKQTQFVGEGPAFVKGYVESLNDATQNLINVLRGKNTITNPDTRNIPLATSGAASSVEKVLAVPTKLLEAMDQFFVTLTKGGERSALSYRQSKGVDVGDIEKLAADGAAYRTFRQDLKTKGQGNLLNGVDEFTSMLMRLRSSNTGWLRTVAKYTLPFVKTPMNILKQGIEYSPAGFATLPGSANKANQLAKAIMGSSVFASAAMLLESGRVTWAEPTSEKKRNEFRAAGMQPYAVKIGDNWVAFSKLPPALAFPFAITAALKDAQENKNLGDGDLNTILETVAKSTNFFADQSYLKNIGDFLATIKGDFDGLARLASNYPQQLLPYRAMLGWITRIVDPYERQIDKNATALERQVQQMMTSIPGMSQNLNPRLDSLGQPVERNNRVLNAFSPVRITTERPEAVRRYQVLDQQTKANRQDNEVREKVRQAGTPQQLGDKYFYDDNGEVKSINLASLLQEPTTKQERARQKSDTWSTINKVAQARGLSDSQKSEIYQKLGVSKDTAEYYSMASDAKEVRDEVLMTYIRLSKTRQDMLELLTKGRMEVNGKKFVTDTTVNELRAMGLLTSSEAKRLKATSYAPGSKPLAKISGRGGGASIKVKKLTAPGIKRIKVRPLSKLKVKI